MRRGTALLLGAVLSFSTLACGDDADDDDDTPADGSIKNDGGATGDAGGDSGTPGLDGSIDAGGDAGGGNIDSGADASRADGSVTPGDSGASDARVADAASMDGATAESFAAIYSSIITPKCATATCHGSGTPSGNLDLRSVSTAHMELLLAAEGAGCAGDAGGGTRVVPGNANDSLLIKKLTLTDEQVCGNRMPRNADPLSAPEIERIRSWIAAGAPNN